MCYEAGHHFIYTSHPALEEAMKQAKLDFSIEEENWIAETMGKD